MNLAYERSFPSPISNSTLFVPLLLSLAADPNSPKTTSRFRSEYDYIVVGAGAAGSTVASRLSELPCVSVLLLEAGREAPIISDVPILTLSLREQTTDWNLRSTPQKHTGSALPNRQLKMPMGKGLGGSTFLNAMIYSRGNRRNYDDWARAGATGWSYDDVLPYFLKMENNRDPELVANGYHGVSGPVSVETSKYHPVIRDPVLEAASQMGYKVVDSNALWQTGFYDYQTTKRNGQRCSAAKAYLVPAENRTNLDIVINAHVTKILIEDGCATGVSFDIDGFNHQVRSRKEVIVSAGTVHTAQLLLLSGIGPQEDLKKLDIPVNADLPVGENLQDHICGLIHFALDASIPMISEEISADANILEYIQRRTGPLDFPAALSMLAFLKDQDVSPSVDFPNYELYFFQSEALGDWVNVGYKSEVYHEYFRDEMNSSLFTCISSLLQPRSTGTVKLSSTDPHDPPLVDPNYFSDPRDMQDVMQGLKLCHKIGTSQPMREQVGSRPFGRPFPGCESHTENLDLYLECLIRSAVVSIYHYAGTAKMGDTLDPTTVVDPQLRVKGIHGLRVVDASVMPFVTSGNTQAPVYVIAEKAANMIKGTIRCESY